VRLAPQNEEGGNSGSEWVQPIEFHDASWFLFSEFRVESEGRYDSDELDRRRRDKLSGVSSIGEGKDTPMPL